MRTRRTTPPDTRRPWRTIAVTLAAAALAHALAAGPSFGVLLSPTISGAPIVTVSAALPVARLATDAGQLAFGARADVSATLDQLATLPALGLHATATLEQSTASVYAGTGIGLARQRTAAGSNAILTWTLLAGVRVPIDPTWSVVLQLAAAPLLGGVGIGLGIEVAPWR
jgi:hypothetical protein